MIRWMCLNPMSYYIYCTQSEYLINSIDLSTMSSISNEEPKHVSSLRNMSQIFFTFTPQTQLKTRLKTPTVHALREPLIKLGCILTEATFLASFFSRTLSSLCFYARHYSKVIGFLRVEWKEIEDNGYSGDDQHVTHKRYTNL